MNTLWKQAIARNDLQMVEGLLEGCAGLNVRNRYGQTPLMLAAHAGRQEIVKMLIAHHAELDITAKFGLSALMLAVVAGHAEIARLLAGAGADLSLRGTGASGFFGKTAHDLALDCGMLDLATALKPRSGRRNRN